MNFFLAGHKWAIRQDENYTTEAFVYVLKYLLEHAPSEGKRLLSIVAAIDDMEKATIENTDSTKIDIRTQVTIEKGRPDISIEIPGLSRVFVEVKVESEVGETQISRYGNEGRVVLLSRYPYVASMEKVDQAQADEGAITSERPDMAMTWHQVGTEFRSMLTSIHNPVASFLVDQFHEFLKRRNMTFDKVDRTLVAGVASLLSLYHMLGEAVERACVASSTAPSNGEGYMGYSLDKTKFWCGYSYSRPEEILFQLNSGTFDGETAQSEGFQKSATGLWTRSLKLNECHFFDEVKREKQAKLLFDFLKDAYERGKRCCVQ